MPFAACITANQLYLIHPDVTRSADGIIYATIHLRLRVFVLCKGSVNCIPRREVRGQRVAVQGTSPSSASLTTSQISYHVRQLSQRAGILLWVSNQNSNSLQLRDRRMLNRRCVWLWIFVLQKEFATPPNVAFRVILATATLTTARLWRTYPVRSNWRVARFSQMPRVLIYLRARK